MNLTILHNAFKNIYKNIKISTVNKKNSQHLEKKKLNTWLHRWKRSEESNQPIRLRQSKSRVYTNTRIGSKVIEAVVIYFTYAISGESNQFKFTLSFLVPTTKRREWSEVYQRETKKERQPQSPFLPLPGLIVISGHRTVYVPDPSCSGAIREKHKGHWKHSPSYKWMLPQRSESD